MIRLFIYGNVCVAIATYAFVKEVWPVAIIFGLVAAYFICMAIVETIEWLKTQPSEVRNVATLSGWAIIEGIVAINCYKQAGLLYTLGAAVLAVACISFLSAAVLQFVKLWRDTKK